MTKRILFYFSVFFLSLWVIGQDFDPRIESATLAIDGKNRKGYLTRFSISAKKLEKSWWKYCKEFGRPLNMKSYYKVTVPSQLNSGNVDITLLSKSMANKTGSTFFLTLEENGIPKSKLDGYNKQIIVILQSFKTSLVVSELAEQLEDLEKKAAKVSKRVAKSSGNSKEKHLRNLGQLEAEIEHVKSQLETVNNAY